MDKEIYTLLNINCSKVVRRPRHEKVLHTKLGLEQKRNEKGIFRKYKACLVVFGNKEKDERLDKFSPVYELAIVKLTLCMVIRRGWKMRDIDVQNAFPHVKLERAVFAELPKEYISRQRNETSVILLQGRLYGLRVATPTWNNLLTTHFEKAGVKPLKRTPCVSHANQIITVFYLDDLLVYAKEDWTTERFKSRLSETVVQKDLGFPSQFLIIGLSWKKAGIVGLSQKRLVGKPLEITKMDKSERMSSPMKNGLYAHLDTIPLTNEEATAYRIIVGSLLSLAIKTMPDMPFTARKLGAKVAAPAVSDIRRSQRNLQYL